MDDRQPLHAFYAILIAICYITTVAAVLAGLGKYVEALGFGSIIVGLIGLSNPPRSKSVTVDNPPSNPVPVAADEVAK